VLLHLLPNPATNSFKVIAAGSSSSEMEDSLSLRTEVFDSVSWKWTETGMINGPEFCLNEYQTGVCKDGILYCIGFVKAPDFAYKRNLLAYDLAKGEWMTRRLCDMPIPEGKIAHTAQLVENDQEIFLFLEEATLREEGPVQLIAKLETFADSEGKLVRWNWKTVMRKTIGQQSNCEEPEYTCVPYGVGKLCIFNNIERRGVVYDVVKEREEQEGIPSPPASGRRLLYHSLNPLAGSFQAGYKATCSLHHAGVMKGHPNFTLSASQERLSKRLYRQVSREIRKLYTPSHTTEEELQICDFLSIDLLKNCLVKLPLYEDLYRMKPVSKPMKQCIESGHFQFLRGKALASEGLLTAVHFTGNESGVWQGSSFDLESRKWRRLPPLVIPSQAADPSSQTSYVIAGGGGLICFLSASSSSAERSATVWNPCTQKSRSLPALRLSWKQKLLHLISDLKTMSYKVIVAGYARRGEVSSIHAVIYDSTTSTWTAATSDITRTDLRIKQFQTGAVVGHILYCIAVDRNETKHVLQYNVETSKWLVRSVPLPDLQQNATQFRSTNEAQLVECSGDLYLFVRQGFPVEEQSLYRLVQPSTADPHWEHLWRRPEESGRYPEYTCAPFGEDKLCIFNTKDVTGFVFDVHDHLFSELPSVCKQVDGITFGIQNHLGLTLQLNFKQQP
jgi:hypothetical protein